VAVVLLAGIAGLTWWALSPDRTLGRLEHEEVSAFSRIRVRRAGDVRVLTFVRDDGRELVQSRMDVTAPGTLLSPYAHSMFASYLYQPEPRRVLIVGLGGGAMVRFLAHHQPHLTIDAVEIDPAVVRLAGEYFGVRAGGTLRVVTADAVGYVGAVEAPYDVIFMDAFLRPSNDTDATGVPASLKTLAFLERLKQALAPGGVVAFNLNEHEHLAADIAAITATFGQVAVFRSPPADNRVVIGTAAPMPGDADLTARAGALETRFGGAVSFAGLLRRRE